MCPCNWRLGQALHCKIKLSMRAKHAKWQKGELRTSPLASVDSSRDASPLFHKETPLKVTPQLTVVLSTPVCSYHCKVMEGQTAKQ